MKPTRLLWTTVFLCSLVAASAGEQPSALADGKTSAVAIKSGIADGELSPALTGERRPLYRLHKSDVIELSFTFSPEFNQTLTVQPDGFATLKDLPEAYVEGLTLPELQGALTKAYAGVLHDPQITITLKDFDKPYFIASGEVSKPGKYELRGDTTVTEAIAMAGGFNGQAKHSQVVLFRRFSDGLAESRVLNIKQMLQSKNHTEDLHLKPGDLLFVPQNTISKVRRYLPISSLGAYWNPAQF